MRCKESAPDRPWSRSVTLRRPSRRRGKRRSRRWLRRGPEAAAHHGLADLLALLVGEAELVGDVGMRAGDGADLLLPPAHRLDGAVHVAAARQPFLRREA